MAGDLVLVKNLNVGGLAKPVTALVNKVSLALGGPFVGAFRPMQIRRVAEAEADAIRIHGQADADVAEIRQRTANRLLAQEMRNQANIESIMEKAIPHVTDEAEPEQMDDDWIVNWSEKCRIVSDEQIQEMWARILAGEANNPGTFSRKTINILADMDKTDAERFAFLLNFAWAIGSRIAPMVYLDDDFFEKYELNLEALADLESLGLISLGSLPYGLSFGGTTFRAAYFDRVVEITLSKEDNNFLSTGNVMLTPAGQQIGSICRVKPIEGFFDFIYRKWEADSEVKSVSILG
ncbi:MAG: DUF2806 domain-containing protein [Chloroflexota bacterium]|nr:DUF2806 domain-containing protein [Chloroflexota bacterium]